MPRTGGTLSSRRVLLARLAIAWLVYVIPRHLTGPGGGGWLVPWARRRTPIDRVLIGLADEAQVRGSLRNERSASERAR